MSWPSLRCWLGWHDPVGPIGRIRCERCSAWFDWRDGASWQTSPVLTAPVVRPLVKPALPFPQRKRA